ncbi:MAG: His Kinase (Phospho-acceptor) protein, partial [Rhizorhabdus sp.]|nr:His Kinase (Phospho-acceptor) protein [Rhizorhabdus sp.]
MTPAGPDQAETSLNAVTEELYELRRAHERQSADLATTSDDLANLTAAGRISAIFLDAGLAIRSFTPEAARHFELGDADIGRPVASIGWRIAFDGLNDITRDVMASGIAAARDVYQIDGGWLSMRVQPYRSSAAPRSQAGIVLLFEDIQALKVAHASLDKRSADLQSFAYAVSHDLQEPARMIISFAELLDRRYGNVNDEVQAEYLEQIRSGGRRLRDMLDSLLRYSRVDTRGAVMANFPLDHALAAARASLAERIAAEGATILSSPLPSIWGDEDQLVWIFRELIENALKFRSSAAPQIRIGAAMRGDGVWRIEVADNGIGISGGQADHAFRIFKRLRAHKTGDGVGAGLAVVARIVER